MTALDIPAITSRAAEAVSWLARLNTVPVPAAVKSFVLTDAAHLLAENANLRADVEHLRVELAAARAERVYATEPGS